MSSASLPLTHCPSAQGAIFQVSGCANLAVNTTTFTVSNLPTGLPGIFFYGPFQVQVGSGSGWLCVGGTVVRVLPAQFADPMGKVSLAVDLTQPPYSASLNTILPGSTWNFQYWYRDPTGGLFPYNFSNAMQVTFSP